MSVIRPKIVQTYMAPIVSSPEDISLAGSWSKKIIVESDEDEFICRHLVKNWDIDFGPKNKVSQAQLRLYFCVNSKNKGFAVLSICSTRDFEPYLEKLSGSIQRLLRTSKARQISMIFQQEQPGDGSGVSVIGSAGNVGANQSDW